MYKVDNDFFSGVKCRLNSDKLFYAEKYQN